MDFLGAEVTHNTTGKYINEIDGAIDKLSQDILTHANNSDTNHGFMAEYWHADTLNIMSKVMRTGFYAHAEDSSESRGVLGGADIKMSDGGQAGLKYCNTGYSTAMHQARPLENIYQQYLKKNPGTSREDFLKIKHLDPNTDFTLSLYESQARVCPADQLEDIRKALERKIAELRNNLDNADRAKYAKAYEETLAMITDHLEGPNGEKSIPLTYDQSRLLMQCAKEGKFDPKTFDVDAAKLADRSFMFMNSLEAGASAALVSCVLNIAPKLISMIKDAIEDGEFSLDDLENIGKSGTSAAAEGFIRGTMMSCLTSAAELGYLGETLKSASASASFEAGVATAVTLLINTTKETLAFHRCAINGLEYAANMDRSIFIACASYASGVGLQSVTPIPYVGYMIGSFLGSVIGGLAYEAKEQFFISLCVHSGHTLWGIVEQDYILPRDVCERLGYELMERVKVENCDFMKHSVKYAHFRTETFKYERLDYTPMIRGVVGVRKIGYIAS